MPRALPEWIGRTDDTAPPPHVKLRVFEVFGGRCQCGCERKIHAGEAWECDHAVALVNGGENREANLQPILAAHHPAKTASDVAAKARVYKFKARHQGVAKASRPLPAGRKSGLKKTMAGAVVLRFSQAEQHRMMMRRRDLCGKEGI